MPWHPGRGHDQGVVAFLVRAIFAVLEASIFVVFLPVRAVSTVAGRGIIWLLRLPLQILGLAARLIGLLLVAAIVLLVIVAVLHLVSVA